MISTPYLRLLLLSYICIICLVSLPNPTYSAIGIYNFGAGVTSAALPVKIDYRLNYAGEVTIEIRNSGDTVVGTMGPYTESAGQHTHIWDNGGAALPGGNYRARIRATHNAGPAPEHPTLTPLFGGKQNARAIYGLAIDRFEESPGYGTIYVSKVAGGGSLLAFNADGSPKYWPPAYTSNELILGLYLGGGAAPWGIGVDKLGNIYVSCTKGVDKVGVAVYNYLGTKQPYVLRADPAGIIWLDGLATANGLEVYETKGNSVRYSAFRSESWPGKMEPGVPGDIKANGICFEKSGSACYVATSGISSDSAKPNPGVTRFVRDAGGAWSKDLSFDCGMSAIPYGMSSAAGYAMGVSCDARASSVPGYSASTLWVGMSTGNADGGNLARVALASGNVTLFYGPDWTARFVAADSVGNVAVEYGAPTSGSLWSWWGMWYPAGESSEDIRVTNWVTLAGTAERKTVNRIRELKQEPADSLVQLSSGCRVTAVFADCFYIEDDDRSCGIKVKCATPVSEGSLVKVGGKMSSEQGERCLAEAEIISP